MRVVLSITSDGSLREDQTAPDPRTSGGRATRASLEQGADHTGSPACVAHITLLGAAVLAHLGPEIAITFDRNAQRTVSTR